MNDRKPVGLFLDKPLEYNDGNLLNLYVIGRYVNAGVRQNIDRGVGRYIVGGLGIGDGNKF